MSDAPLILVTNDDGFLSEGINAMLPALEALGDVWMMAPQRERSAVSHAITLHKPLRIKEVAPQRFWCSGTPTDCVFVAVNHVLPRKPTLVVSGINRGANLGDDVTYSGTVGAAVEARMLGIPSLAASLANIGEGQNFDGAAVLVQRIATEILEKGVPEGIVLNLNVPTGYDPAKGVRSTKLGRRHYGRHCDENNDPRGRRYLWIGGAAPVYVPSEGSDVTAIHEGFASLTPIQIDMSAHGFVDELAGWDALRRG
ncbi:MAG: 5'-nucleotidase [Bradymonadia bacterium]|jgi:5'-nucleotidase